VFCWRSSLTGQFMYHVACVPEGECDSYFSTHIKSALHFNTCPIDERCVMLERFCNLLSDHYASILRAYIDADCADEVLESCSLCDQLIALCVFNDDWSKEAAKAGRSSIISVSSVPSVATPAKAKRSAKKRTDDDGGERPVSKRTKKLPAAKGPSLPLPASLVVPPILPVAVSANIRRIMCDDDDDVVEVPPPVRAPANSAGVSCRQVGDINSQISALEDELLNGREAAKKFQVAVNEATASLRAQCDHNASLVARLKELTSTKDGLRAELEQALALLGSSGAPRVYLL
jgi:hypothetical protein